MITIPRPKPLAASVRAKMAQGVPLHKAMAGASSKSTGARVKVGK